MADTQNKLYEAPAAPPAPQAIELTAPQSAPAPLDASRARSYDMLMGMNSNLVNRDGQQFPPSLHLAGKHVLVYFSAHWSVD